MATHNKKTAKTSKGAKAKPVVKKAAPAKKTVAVKQKPAAKPAAKKPVKPVKKAAPAKVAAKPVKKETNNKSAKNNSQKTVNKKNSKQAPPAKKAVPAKKAAPVAKKAVPVAKKAAPAKPAAKTPAKPVAKPAAKAPAKPEPKAAAKAPAKPEPKVAAKPTKTPSHKKLTLTQMPTKANPALPKPTATPAARPIEKKPNVIIAHRRMENKSKKDPVSTPTGYQPETYRSILDEPQVAQGPVYRYSDEELSEFREIITSRLDAARKELNYLQGLITRKDEAGTEDTENRYMNMEDGSGAMEREQLAQLASRQIQFMNHLEKALVRIENKTYGICRVTGKLIDKARLRAVPHATLSIEAKKFMNTKQN